MSAPTIRAVSDVDIPAICEIYNHYVRASTATFDEVESTPADWAAKRARIEAAGIPFLIAETDGVVCGYALGQPWSPKAAYRRTIENSIYLDPSAAGRGVGGMLLARFLESCREAGLRQVIAVIADRGAEASIALHRRAGFADAGRLTDVGHKLGLELGVHLLQKSL
ncbi:N-acetyltransferase family protein [Microbacterium sp. Mu-80]|uniref:N-acetyltransferase family protein n=1 Tax=Microbacterium bandirmense TaxID=3122050 RepID=A0ABU8LC17_9MICO